MGVNYQAKATSATGYQISKDGGTNWGNYYNGMFSRSETLYVLPAGSTSGANAMWLASPCAYSSDCVVTANYSGGVLYGLYSGTHIGFRPVVRLNSGVSITDNGDGSVTLK